MFYAGDFATSWKTKINNTLVYTQLVDFGDDEYMVRVAYTIEEDK